MRVASLGATVWPPATDDGPYRGERERSELAELACSTPAMRTEPTATPTRSTAVRPTQDVARCPLATAGFITYQPLLVAIDGLHLNDAFQFQRSVKVQLEAVGHAGANTIIARDHAAWATTAFWYAPP
jgi:hypothetical protein